MAIRKKMRSRMKEREDGQQGSRNRVETKGTVVKDTALSNKKIRDGPPPFNPPAPKVDQVEADEERKAKELANALNQPSEEASKIEHILSADQVAESTHTPSVKAVPGPPPK